MLANVSSSSTTRTRRRTPVPSLATRESLALVREVSTHMSEAPRPVGGGLGERHPEGALEGGVAARGTRAGAEEVRDLLHAVLADEGADEGAGGGVGLLAVDLVEAIQQ